VSIDPFVHPLLNFIREQHGISLGEMNDEQLFGLETIVQHYAPVLEINFTHPVNNSINGPLEQDQRYQLLAQLSEVPVLYPDMRVLFSGKIYDDAMKMNS